MYFCHVGQGRVGKLLARSKPHLPRLPVRPEQSIPSTLPTTAKDAFPLPSQKTPSLSLLAPRSSPSPWTPKVQPLPPYTFSSLSVQSYQPRPDFGAPEPHLAAEERSPIGPWRFLHLIV
ncbi:hypothetical protein P170DRAFT_439150 [Aspergillus steynii IBT 23096]|uniref:Uncharacterized protein n=1 Tax=Aspergillus steynii IBT 23096 TaxID=1392250 RepID=A0A2I2FXP7_9EURO|nr:uncharacterized protein P170DRAFT_439150 [Aspergillus steynii IBT 23096]PLB45382.1 hypothetical protein P170DRAFT_439150 [Aspergillus steynii IBT 23096]